MGLFTKTTVEQILEKSHTEKQKYGYAKLCSQRFLEWFLRNSIKYPQSNISPIMFKDGDKYLTMDDLYDKFIEETKTPR